MNLRVRCAFPTAKRFDPEGLVVRHSWSRHPKGYWVLTVFKDHEGAPSDLITAILIP